MLYNKLVKKIEFEISEIGKELESYKILIDLCKVKEPDLIEKTAVASVLHCFYTGVENILVAIAKNFDKSIPADKNWHNKLLNQLSEKTEKREAVLTKDNMDFLLGYLGFRHFYRHSYSFYLDWVLLSKLILPIEDIWNAVKKDFNNFVNYLKKQKDND